MNAEIDRGAVRQTLTRLRGRTENSTVNVKGIEVVVFPTVFPPTTDSLLLADHIQVLPGQRVLDTTAGSGIISIVAGKQGATGVAVDIHPDAVENAKHNVSAHGVSFDVFYSNLYQNVPSEEFDVITANGPYLDRKARDGLERATYGTYSFVDGLLAGLPQYLKPDGKLLVTYAEWGELAYWEDAVSRGGFQSSMLERRVNALGNRHYRMYEVRLNG